MSHHTRWTEYPQSLEPLARPEESRQRAAARPAPAADQPFDDWRQLAGRLRIPIAVFMVIGAAVLFRLAALQIGAGAGAAVAAPAAPDVSRGRIVDRRGLLMATDSFIWELYANPRAIRNSSERAEVIARVAQILGQPVSAVQAELDEDKRLVTLAGDLTEAQRQEIEALDQNLVWAGAQRTRAYPQGSLAAHLIGYTNRDQIGRY